jgi:hypothetical protein
MPYPLVWASQATAGVMFIAQKIKSIKKLFQEISVH